MKLLIANRGEIAVRIARTASERGIATVGVYSQDDARSLHVRRVDEARPLAGSGARAYLDADAIIAIARETGCDALHPGYGFLSEQAELARRCEAASVAFVGPQPEVLELLGEKTRARDFAEGAGVAVLPGRRVASGEEARDFMAGVGGTPVALKAVAGGGGRGMRVVERADDIAEAFERCASEARAAFGDGSLYVERFLGRARHIEVQTLGDSDGNVSHLWERDCTIQRRFQKLVEIAPAPALPREIRDRLIEAALEMAAAARLRSLATFEFLIDATTGEFFFIEANARLQVEHTVTEAITGVDLVAAQLDIAQGRSLADIGVDLRRVPAPRGFAVQARVNAETLRADGSLAPSSGVIAAFDPPSGLGVRVDTHAYAGYTLSPAFDPLLAKVIAHAPEPSLGAALQRARRALAELRIDGVATNVELLQGVLAHPDVAAGAAHTRWVEEHAGELTAGAEARRLFFEERTAAGEQAIAGVRVDPNDPLAVLELGKSGVREWRSFALEEDTTVLGAVAVRAPIQGTVISVDVAEGELVHAGQRLFVMEAMKMEHVVSAACAGRVQQILVAMGDAVFEGAALALIEETDDAGAPVAEAEAADVDEARADLAEVQERHAITLDEARPDAVERRRRTGQRTARENIADLVDPGSFVEYGPLVIAAQRRRRPVEELIERTPADGLVAGIGRVNGELFGPERSRCIVMSYDYTVLAGTQGMQNHRKKDRMFELAARWRLPVVLFAEGGGGRPGDTDGLGVAGLDTMAFHYFGGLSGLAPLVGIVSGRCFAGNAALLGCCDVVISTKDANIGMGGPAMVEGGGLGVFRPDEIGPADVQARNGVIDVLVDDEAAAVAVAKQYLSYFQGALREPGEAPDQRLLRSIIPENRRRVYDVRRVIHTLADEGSVLELRRHFGAGMVTALARIEGRPLGVIANNPMHLAGAIDADAADKAARFMQLCDAHDVPLLFLCDTPGIMVGPEAEKTALVRHASRMFVTGASLTVPFFTIVLRKGYGLGAQAMAGGSFKAPVFTVAWPTGEFGGMGLEGAVKLGYRNELAAIDDPAKRKALFDEMVERMYRHGKAVNTASHFEIDDVIDPAESRRWIVGALDAAPEAGPRAGKKRPHVDTW